MVGERVLVGPGQVVPLALGLGVDRGDRDELVPAVGVGAALGSDAAGEDVHEPEAARHLPAALVAGRRGPPGVAGEPAEAVADHPGDLADAVLVDAAHPGRLGRGVLGVVVEQGRADVVEHGVEVGPGLGEEGLPVDPTLDERLVPGVVLDQQPGDGEQQEGLGAGPRREPVVGLGGGVGEPGVDADDRGAVALALEDPLGVRVEVVPGLEVRRDQEDDLGVGEVGRRTVEPHPGGEADSGATRADVGVAVLAVDAPRVQDPLHVAVVAHPTDVVHDLVLPTLPEGGADAGADLVEGLVPGDALPEALAALTHPLHGVQDPFGVLDLVEGGGALGAVAAAAGGVDRVALELGDLPGVLVDVGQQAAVGLAVEAGGRHQPEASLDALGPGLGVEGPVVVPLLLGRVGGQHRGLLTAVKLLMRGARTVRPARRRPRRRTARPAPLGHRSPSGPRRDWGRPEGWRRRWWPTR